MKRILIAALLFALPFWLFAQTAYTLNMLPLPHSVKTMAGRFIFTNKFNVGVNGPASPKLIAAVNRFYQQLGRRTGIYLPQEFISAADNQANAQFSIIYEKTIEPVIGMDESYSLTISNDKINLHAATDIGAEHGLQTLYQLVMADGSAFYAPLVSINDSPRFKWRGLMLDVSRHFIPFGVVKRNLDAMAIVKLNVLHLHLSDDEGFRVESKVYPLLQEKGSNGNYYTQDQVKELVKYAHDRGIIVVPEFDLPGHSSSILAAYPFLASYPADYKPCHRYKLDTVKNMSMMKVMKMLAENPTPTIDPTKETTYVFFDKFINEMGALFPDAYFHVGADENNGAAWKQNPQIAAYMKARGMKTTDDLQAYFVKRMYAIAKKHGKRMIGWEETFNQSLPEDAIVQRWKAVATDTLSGKVISHGNQLIVSTGYYLDLYMPAYIHYLNDPVSPGLSAADAAKGILGGEAAQWSELMDGNNEELRVWPRAAAIAERLWSDAAVKDVNDMYRRLWTTDFELNNIAIDGHGDEMRALIRWVNNGNPGPVLALAAVYTPVKGYKRLMGGMLGNGSSVANLTSPLVAIADVVPCDSKTGWQFRQVVSAYLSNRQDNDLQAIKAQLVAWQNNKAPFDALKNATPYIRQIADLSDQLSAAATIALQALNNEGSKDEQIRQLQQMEPARHEVQLAVLPEIEALVSGKLNPLPAAYPMF